jgi:hypothetical protein
MPSGNSPGSRDGASRDMRQKSTGERGIPRPPWRRRAGLLPCREGCKAMLRRHFSNWRRYDALVVHFSVNREDQLGVE